MSRFEGYILDGPHKGAYERCQIPYLRIAILKEPKIYFRPPDQLFESESIKIAEYQWNGNGWLLLPKEA